MSDAPISYVWEGDCFKPASGFWQRKADEQFTIGERYRLEESNDRSASSHAHYFAALHDGWSSLPDPLLADYPTAEHLRKKLLVRAGYAHEAVFVSASKAEAVRLAAFLKNIDTYAVIVPKENCVRVYTAESQSYRAMGRDRFNESKAAVLNELAKLLGIDRRELEKANAA